MAQHFAGCGSESAYVSSHVVPFSIWEHSRTLCSDRDDWPWTVLLVRSVLSAVSARRIRARGATEYRTKRVVLAIGGSPRVRGSPGRVLRRAGRRGSIPARAGRPAGGRRSAGAAGIHPCRFCVRLPSGRRHPRQFRGPHLRRRCARVCGFSPRLERRVEVAALAWDVGRGLPPCFSVGGYLSPRRVARMFPVRGDRWARQQKACTLHEPFWFGVFSQCIH